MRPFDYLKFRLFVAHSKLNDAIAQEQKHLHADVLRITYLKKLRLAVKDRLSACGKGQHSS